MSVRHEIPASRSRVAAPARIARMLAEPVTAGTIIVAIVSTSLAASDEITFATKLYHKCHRTGTCAGPEEVCGPTSGNSRPCRYCLSFTSSTYECKFSLFDYCVHYTHTSGPASCGEERSGTCAPVGGGWACIDGIATGKECVRTVCFTTP